MRPAAGSLRHRIIIERSESTKVSGGDYVTTWLPVHETRAEVISLNGREAVIGRALQGVSSYRLTIRHKSGIVSSDRVRLISRTFGEDKLLNIRAADDPDGRRERLVILADTEGVEV